MFFSIAIPTYEMRGNGVDFLEFSFQKIHTQSFKDFEVIISDHSINQDIQILCNKWSNRMNIQYYKNDSKRGSSSSNINNAVSKCKGEWVKILFQDDFLFEYDSLEKIYNHINKNPNISWIATACEHSNDGLNFYRPFYPKWNEDIQYGNNTLSSPSVISFKNKFEDNILFDENLIWLMDVDFYKRMYDLYGEPAYISDINVVNRTWGSRLSDTIDDSLKNNELKFLVKKYKDMEDKSEFYFNRLCNLKFDNNVIYSRGIVDINEHLPTLRKYASECKHVTEMGTRFAVSTFAFLIASPEKFVSIDLNYHFFKPFETEVLEFASECGVDFKFIEADVLKIDIENTDLLFIDTLHTYNQLSMELRRHEKNVNKWIILHDTITFGEKDEEFYRNGDISDEISNKVVDKRGIYIALMDFLEENKKWKIKEHFINNNGLTILERI